MMIIGIKNATFWEWYRLTTTNQINTVQLLAFHSSNKNIKRQKQVVQTQGEESYKIGKRK